MQLVEQHCIDKQDSRYAIIDEAAFKSKNLYNAALYEMRQAFIHQGVSFNILRKSKPDAFSKAKGVAGYVVHPLRLAVAV